MGAERRFTGSLQRFFGPPGRGVAVPIGDDAAVVANRGAQTVLACDPVVEGVHFASDAPLYLVGRKAVNRNLSDLAAMGAVPDYLLVSLVLPPGLATHRRRRLLEGIRQAAGDAGCAVVGGDSSRSPGPLVVTVTALGHLRSNPLERRGARPGDAIFVTGPVGGAGLGHHLRFPPHLREGQWLARCPGVTAAIDISDGLALDLATLVKASGAYGAVLEASAIPLTRAAHRAGRQTGRSPLDHGLGDGEDHVLLFTSRGPLPPGGPLTSRARQPLGRVTRAPGLRLRGPEGERVIPGDGYEHEL